MPNNSNSGADDTHNVESTRPELSKDYKVVSGADELESILEAFRKQCVNKENTGNGYEVTKENLTRWAKKQVLAGQIDEILGLFVVDQSNNIIGPIDDDMGDIEKHLHNLQRQLSELEGNGDD